MLWFLSYERSRLVGSHVDLLLAYWKDYLYGCPQTTQFTVDRKRTNASSPKGAIHMMSTPLALLNKIELFVRRPPDPTGRGASKNHHPGRLGPSAVGRGGAVGGGRFSNVLCFGKQSLTCNFLFAKAPSALLQLFMSHALIFILPRAILTPVSVLVWFISIFFIL